MKHIAVFASGSGSNARKLIEHFKHSSLAKVTLVVCNKPGAGVLDIAQEHGVEQVLITRQSFYGNDDFLSFLREKQIDFVVLAGFLWLAPEWLVKAFAGRIVNIHPALLPKYGGKGMYGMHVHEAVIAAGEKESGITIHHVDEHFDEGATIFQASCPIEPGDTAADLAKKVQVLEHRYFPEVVEKLIKDAS